ncbi:AbrB/MazE/SpoVT family DNA-binding domain-containing protein [Microseira wollei]|uniref:Addiction module antidote n=1 Tax=Microseira wollei NIES-4236 TaxID=2530354 RepID=A0AAV3X878_9CYAN|nr:hypothetical protein [Microseira wollei]GET37558.1 addiction module antidote [Microseira wollei NIES-4236]
MPTPQNQKNSCGVGEAGRMPTPQNQKNSCGVGEAGRMPTPQNQKNSCGVGVSPALSGSRMPTPQNQKNSCGVGVPPALPGFLVQLISKIQRENVMYTLKVQKMGDALVITLPEELLKQLNLSEGDSLLLTETPEGMQLTTGNPEFETAMEIYRKGSEKYKNALRELAK